ncbi:MAG: AEC family transporter [Oscillospiraceae bacterium]
MTVLIEKMALLVMLLALGYLCARLKLVGPEFNKGLSKLVINVFLAGMILSSVINKKLEMTGGDVAFGLLMMTLSMLICVGIGWLSPTLLRIKDGDKGMYRMLAAFMNNGFMGFPLVAAVYGENAVFFASLSNIPFNLLLYTVGVMLLQKGDKSTKFSIKSVINVPIVATLIAFVIFIFEIPMPKLVDDVADTLSAATVPLSMMCVGLSLGSVSLKEALMQPRLYGISLVRLLICPLAVWLVLRIFITNPVILGTIVLLTACPSAIICTILGIQYGRDGVESSEAIFISTMLSMISIPLLISVLGL